MSVPVLSVVMATSILLQILSAVVALLLIAKSGFHRPWFLLTAAIGLMAIRRVVSFVPMLREGHFPDSALAPELIALIISACMLFSLLLFFPEFRLLSYKKNLELTERDVLVRESHHHVKNDLQRLQSLVRLQRNSLTRETESSFLRDLETRIQAFSLLHEHLYRGSVGNSVSLSSYLQQLARSVAENYHNMPVQLTLDLADCSLNRADLIHCGLIVNEALTNAFKYAFVTTQNPRITVATRRVENRMVLTVSDNGVGLPQEVIDGNRDSFGLSLVRGICSRPGWQLSIRGSNGTEIEVSFPLSA